MTVFMKLKVVILNTNKCAQNLYFYSFESSNRLNGFKLRAKKIYQNQTRSRKGQAQNPKLRVIEWVSGYDSGLPTGPVTITLTLKTFH